jgi:L-iditol 2-dehydrogenase
MLAARLYGPRDLRLEKLPAPGAPAPDQVLLAVRAVGVCGSDLHSYVDGRIGDAALPEPVVLGHEFSGVVLSTGSAARDGQDGPLAAGALVAVDPAQPCHRCEMCEQGHPNLCWRLHFCGLWPDQGSLCERMLVPARTCFSMPEGTSAATAALLEPLGIAIHAVDLCKLRIGQSAAVLGAGPIGLLLLQCLRAAGANPVFITDRHRWRLDLARSFGAIPIDIDAEDPVASVLRATNGRGVDVAVEAAFCEETVEQAVALARMGGRVVLVGISSNDRITFKHSTARRKGLTIAMSRRMKHAYSRAVALVQSGRIDPEKLISHRFALSRVDEAFRLNAAYADEVVKIIIDCSGA